MIFGEGFLGLIVLGLWLFCIIDVITTDESSVRNLPKTVWLLIVIVLFDIGSIAWLVAGRNWSGGTAKASSGATGGYPEHTRPGRQVPTNPDDDEAFLRGLRERAEEQRRNHQQQRQAELKAEEDRLKKPPVDEP